jgi:hypothetical protein
MIYDTINTLIINIKKNMKSKIKKSKIGKNKKYTPLLDKKVIHTENKNIIKIRVPNTKFFVLGEQRRDGKWNMFLTNPQKPNFKELISKAKTTESFSIFSNVILKTPFPYQD